MTKKKKAWQLHHSNIL